MPEFGTIYYVRHGENVSNVAGIFTHRTIDEDLTDRGREQARHAAEFIAAQSLGAGPIFTSPLRRAVQTARVIADRLGGRKVEIIEEFYELNVGELEGQGGEAVIQGWWGVLEAWAAGHRETRFAGGENHLELTERLRQGFAKLLAMDNAGPHVLVAHAGLLRAGFSHLVHPSPPTRLSIPNGSVSRLEIDPAAQAWSFAYWAYSDFMPDPTIAAPR